MVLQTATAHGSMRMAWRRWAPAAVAAAAALGVGTAYFWPRGSNLAFADVERAMERARIVHWTETRYVTVAPGREQKTYTKDCWARLSPPALYARVYAPANQDPLGPEIVQDARTLLDARGSICQDLATGRYSISPFSRGGRPVPAGPLVRALILSATTMPEPPAPGPKAPYRTAAIAATPWRRTEDRLDGVRCLRFTRSVAVYTLRQVTTLWADPRSGRVIRMQTTGSVTDGRAPADRIVCSDYRYDEVPPAGAFDWSPPSGARIDQVTPPSGPPSTRRRLSAAERAAIQRLIDASDRGWRAGSPALFSSAWDFGYLSALAGSRQSGGERRRMWAVRVTNQKLHLRWRRWQSRLASPVIETGVQDVEGLAVVPGKPTMWQVDALTTVLGPSAKRPVTVEAQYYLRHGPDGFRIVHWSYPWDRILQDQRGHAQT